jgi:Helix-destabilising protein
MLKFQFKTNEVETKTGVSTKSGKPVPYSIREQTAYVAIGDETRRVVIGLKHDQPVYAPGAYVMDDTSFTTDNFGNLAVGRLVLRPLVASAAASAPAARAV